MCSFTGNGMGLERLQKILAAAGVDSRRKCEELILSGMVRVNKRVVDTLPAFADAEKDVISVDGKRVYGERKVYFLLNKPKGVICTSSDPQGRRKAIDLIPAKERVFCVGRLDTDTSGLIILTNDTEMANRLTHPRYEVSKTYLVRVKGEISGEAAERLKRGIWLAERKAEHTVVKVLKRGAKESLLEITIRQGLSRQIRMMFARAGLPVRAVRRSHIGRISDKGLGVGQFRMLSEAEVSYLKKFTAK